MVELRLNILGDFALLRDGRKLAVGGAKQKALLAYLALQEGRPVAREVLADLLWGDRFEQQARQSLRQALFRLNRSLETAGANFLEFREDTVALAVEKFSVDALNFKIWAANNPAQAEAVYHPLLDGLSVPNAVFEEWLAGERARFAELAGGVYDRLSTARLANEPAAALTAAEAWIALDPLDEAAHRRAMEIEISQGEPAAALKRYKTLSELLDRELGIRPSSETRVLADAVRVGEGEAPPPPQGDKPRQGLPVVVVLPFENLSGDREQDYFAIGVSDEIISALSLHSEFVMLSRNMVSELVGGGLSAFAVARELGARYTVQGGVRRAGQALRVLAQLIDTEEDRQLWAHRFEGTSEDVFDFQDEIVNHVAGAISRKIAIGELERLKSRRTASLDAYDLYLRASAPPLPITSNIIESIALLDQALAIDPDFVPAIIQGGLCRINFVRFGPLNMRDNFLAETQGLLSAAHRLAHDDPGTWMLTVQFHLVSGDLPEAMTNAEAGVRRHPHNIDLRAFKAAGHMYASETNMAMAEISAIKALHVPTHWPRLLDNTSAICHLLDGDYETALKFGKQSMVSAPEVALFRRAIAAAHALLNQLDKAREEAKIILKLEPDFTIKKFQLTQPYKKTEMFERYLSGLRMAGIPEE